MSDITNQELVLEAIRRARKRKTPHSGGNFQASRMKQVITLLTHWIEPMHTTQVFNQLIIDKKIVVEGCKFKCVEKAGEKSVFDRQKGRLDRFHPDIPLRQTSFYFTEHGSPLAHTINKQSVRVYHKGRPYWTLICSKVWIIEDGISGSLPPNKVGI